MIRRDCDCAAEAKENFMSPERASCHRDRHRVRRCATYLSAAAATLAVSMSARSAPFAFDAAPGRLPKDVVPVDYTIAVVPNVDAKTLSGTETVRLRVRAATQTIVFNSLNEKLSEVRLDGKPVSKVDSDDSQQLTRVTLARAARSGYHTLRFSYTARIETQPHGLFVQAFVKADGGQERLLSTKMESTDARRMFPCWDEPAFRATFQLTVTVPANWATVSNMPVAKRVVNGALATTTFQRSPKMPSYLVEFTAGDLAELAASVGGTRLGIWAVRGREQDGRVALDNARQILGDYNEYFGFPYPLPKLDSIAVPGGFTGAMENWGAITYNDQLLLLGASSTIADRQRVFSVQAHEMAHQWNGDLVTMGWWDDLWLNESFASWRGEKETDLRNPSWKWWELQDASKERAMRDDARLSSHPIHQQVSDELQAANAFDEITYNKGQAVLRMFEAFLGPNVFREGLRHYIRARAFSNATAADLWDALSAASGVDVATVARDWTEQAGFPLVTVSANCDVHARRSVVLTETRFVLQGAERHAAEPGHWSIPLRIRSGTTGTAEPLLLTHSGQSRAAGGCDEALSVNADAIGFYRVRYDVATLAANMRQFARLPDGDKIALLDDGWALALSGEGQLADYLGLASAMGSEPDTRAWEQIASALGTIEHAERASAQHDAFTNLARSIIKPMADRLGWDSRPEETPDVQELRRTLIGDLGAWGDPEVLGEARRRFGAFVADHQAIKPDDQSVVLSTVSRWADAATFEQLHAIAKAERDETAQRRYYLALMRVRDPPLAQRAARIALSEEIPPQAADIRMHLVGALADRHPALSWSTFTANVDVLLAPYPKYAPLITSQYVPEYFWDGAPLDKLEAWVRSRVPAEMSVNVARGMETARVMRLEGDLLVRSADAFLGTR
jgi:aminopeptidase N